MICCRIADPPEHLEKEAESIAERFFAQFDDDELIPEDAYGKYLREHGSKELLAYLDSSAAARASAKANGLRI